MSIRLRLTLWYVMVLTVGLFVFGGAVYLHVTQNAEATFNQALQKRTLDLAQYVSLKPLALSSEAPDETQLGAANIWIRVVDAGGREIAGGSRGLALAGTPIGLLHDLRPGFKDLGLLRVYVLPLTLRNGSTVGAIQAFTSTKQLQTSNDQLLNALVLTGTIIVSLAAVGGFLIARVALHPVGRITETAREIGDGADLSRRVSSPARRGPLARFSQRDELSRLAATFDRMIERLEGADQRRRRLTADAAHELATPITAVKTEAEVSLRHERTEDEYRTALVNIAAESEHLQHIVDDLFLLASADSGHLPMHRDLVELDQVVQESVRSLVSVASENQVTLTTEEGVEAIVVEGDEFRLGQVVRNLIDNAVRHAHGGGSVTVSCSLWTPSGTAETWARVTVADTGPGVPLEEAERVFERFHRSQPGPSAVGLPPTGSRRGSGLGLAICKALVEAHGGTIRVMNPGRPGAIFGFEIPAAV